MPLHSIYAVPSKPREGQTGIVLRVLLSNHANGHKVPFYNVSTNAASFYHDPPTAEESIKALAEFDADPNILVIIAHDTAPLKALTFFPNGTINDWKSKGYKESMHWAFVNELPYEGTARRDQLVDGLYKDGQKVRGLDLESH